MRGRNRYHVESNYLLVNPGFALKQQLNHWRETLQGEYTTSHCKFSSHLLAIGEDGRAA